MESVNTHKGRMYQAPNRVACCLIKLHFMQIEFAARTLVVSWEGAFRATDTERVWCHGL